MKTNRIILIALCIIPLLSCKKNRRSGDPCISVDKTLVETSETVTVSNCGSEFPSQYVSTTIDWGDGTETTGQTGTHSYTSSGTYTISLMLNGDFASNVLDDVDESKAKQTVTVQ